MSFIFKVLLGALVGSAAAEAEVWPSSKPKASTTLRQWLSTGECFNLALTPQYNNQHSIWGIMEMLREEGLLSKLSGISACSGGSLPGAFIAAGRNFDEFSKAFPKEGWAGLPSSEPKISQAYAEFIQKGGMPETFDKLKTPLALSVTVWDNDKTMFMFPKEAHPMILSEGPIIPAMTAAVAMGNTGGVPDPTCPRCVAGFWPKQIGMHNAVTDGAFTDIWGVVGLKKLPKCNRLLHILPLDYPGQTRPVTSKDIPTHPTDIVTLVVTQPPIASHSFLITGMKQMSGFDVKWTNRTSSEWNNIMFHKSNDAMKSKLDDPFDEEIAPGHQQLIVDQTKLLQKMESFSEIAYDLYFSWRRDVFWKTWSAAGNLGQEYLVQQPGIAAKAGEAAEASGMTAEQSEEVKEMTKKYLEENLSPAGMAKATQGFLKHGLEPRVQQVMKDALQNEQENGSFNSDSTISKFSQSIAKGLLKLGEQIGVRAPEAGTDVEDKDVEEKSPKTQSA